MMHRGLARIAVAAGAVMIGAVIAANPAAATVPVPVPVPVPEFGSATLKLDNGPLKANDFTPKGCDGITGGAKAGTDGWVFSRPVTGATDYGYIFGLIGGNEKVVVLGVSKDGAIGFQVDAAQLQGLNAGKLSSGEAKSLARATEGGGTPGGAPGGFKEIPAPEGVVGGLTATGEGWLQTPAGWQLVTGALLYTPSVKDAPQEFSLVRVCAPKVATPTPTATPTNAPGVGGGSGASLPVTGTNVAVLAGAGVLLVGAGAALFVMRRRRDTTKFVA